MSAQGADAVLLHLATATQRLQCPRQGNKARRLLHRFVPRAPAMVPAMVPSTMVHMSTTLTSSRLEQGVVVYELQDGLPPTMVRSSPIRR